ncbi:hypothetical protein NP511_04685 [Natrinema thermotolerans]|uniref:Uncharacterized protein n=1 Tax=Natrinema thermotolerans TaxID=121872 RepID=A0AAF0PGQ5_9EURY|nr:DNA modification system-associated small protein [Natrinema thermotolerans]QCC57839.1 hypothetical protein DVR14_03955 [Natrinema thermotolerans]WMT08930.1 hypothetical protein NP511_04685 [Natrinema thermotolerans]
MEYSDEVDGGEINRLIEKYAEKHDVPAELLTEIYEAESQVVGMERRSSIHKDVQEAIESHVNEAED